MPVKMSAEDLTEFMARAFPQANEDFIIDAVGEMTLRLALLAKASRKLGDGGIGRFSLYLHQVGLGLVEAGAGDVRLQGAVIGQ